MPPRGKLLACWIPFLSLFGARCALPSPKASTELLCHTNHASECYPRIFQPTEHFQTVHDDQDLPAGIHVRMNLATGVKEARLNVPDPNEDNTSSALTIIDDFDIVGHEPDSEKDVTDHDHDSFLQHPLRPPPDTTSESSSFFAAVNEIEQRGPQNTDELIPALTDLEDLSHSYHWGLTLAKDESMVHKLFQLLLPSDLSLEVRSLAALVFGTAIRNNPAALDAALSHFYMDEWPEGPLEPVIMALLHEQAPVLLNRMMFLLSSLCQDQHQLQRFLDAGGIDILIALYDAGSAGSEDQYKLRRKVTHFVVDNLVESGQGHESSLPESDIDTDWTMIQLHHLKDRPSTMVGS
ncbi:MAG: hypothetical protein Q9210_001536 [Variospora velana]